MRITPASRADLPAVRSAYDNAAVLQQARAASVWPQFSDESILAQIDAGELYCVFDGGTLLGVFTLVREDRLIWGDRERGEHLYLHRVARATTSRRGSLVAIALEWARAECRRLGRRGLRLDTWADNPALLSFYERQGFRLVERRRMGDDARLSPHYRGLELALLEEIDDVQN